MKIVPEKRRAYYIWYPLFINNLAYNIYKYSPF